MLPEKYNVKKLAITLLIVGTGLIAYRRRRFANILIRIFCASIIAPAFVRNNCVFSKSSRDNAKVERKRHDLAEEKLQKSGDEWKEDRIKWFYFINRGCVKRVKLWLRTIEHLRIK